MRKYGLKNVSKRLTIPFEDFVNFLLYRQYIQKEGNKIIPTAMGVDFGYMSKDSESNAMITTKGLIRFSKAFSVLK